MMSRSKDLLSSQQQQQATEAAAASSREIDEYLSRRFAEVDFRDEEQQYAFLQQQAHAQQTQFGSLGRAVGEGKGVSTGSMHGSNGSVANSFYGATDKFTSSVENIKSNSKTPLYYDAFNPPSSLLDSYASSTNFREVLYREAQQQQAQQQQAQQLQAQQRAALAAAGSSRQPSSYGGMDAYDDFADVQGLQPYMQQQLMQNSGYSAVPPPGYICKLCFVEGHWLKNCSMYRERKRDLSPAYAINPLTGRPFLISGVGAA
ncbi:hypothetical protein HK101_004319, partial [Irineochytrium annulatum]